MKKYSILAAVLVLTLSVFTGCGCRRKMNDTVPGTTAPGRPTTAPTAEATVMPETEAVTIPATDHTENDMIDATIETNIPGEADSGNTENTDAHNDSRSRARRVQ